MAMPMRAGKPRCFLSNEPLLTSVFCRTELTQPLNGFVLAGEAPKSSARAFTTNLINPIAPMAGNDNKVVHSVTRRVSVLSRCRDRELRQESLQPPCVMHMAERPRFGQISVPIHLYSRVSLSVVVEPAYNLRDPMRVDGGRNG